jgi:nucleoid-associated protein EbfC
MKGMFDMMKKAQDMQRQMGAMQTELANAKFVGKAGGGLVEVDVNGTHSVLAVRIKPEAVDPADVATLEDLVRVALNDAVAAATTHAEARMKSITGGLSIPGLM